jgi:serine phosphatase RsbU (regulator of sigma subunit)
VPDGEDERVDLRRLLAAVEEAPPIEAVDVLGAELANMVEASHVSLLIANFSGDAVVRLSHITGGRSLRDGHNERVESLSLTDSIYQRVLLTQRLEVVQDGDHWLVLLPVTERGDAIGILELSLAEQPDTDTTDYLVAAAHALAYVLIASRRHTDLFEWAQRDVPFSLAAEIQRRLLPSAYTAEGGYFTIAGWLEPAYNAGGDTFDYSIDREYLYASITDAMGHATDAALLATFTLGTLRNTRRALASPAEQADAANAGLLGYARADQFVTGQLVRVRLADGHAELVNAGHPLPYLMRAGRLADLGLSTELPFGVLATPYTTQALQLHPGDRLLLVTDGYLDRSASRVDIEGILAASADRHPRQVVQELAHNVLKATKGELRDDATVVCIDWYGSAGRRDATGGASRARATASSRP